MPLMRRYRQSVDIVASLQNVHLRMNITLLLRALHTRRHVDSASHCMQISCTASDDDCSTGVCSVRSLWSLDFRLFVDDVETLCGSVSVAA